MEMAKLRLNKEMREALTAFANENVRSTSFSAAVDGAYAKALPLVLAAVAKKYPAADMDVLAKYDLAKPDSCLIGYSGTSQQLRFNCRGADAPTVPSGYCSSRNYSWPDKCASAIEDYNFKVEQANEETRRILRDYHTLIANYQTVEDVLEVWPAAQSVLQGFLNAANRNLPASLPVEAIERIKSLNIGSNSLARAA
jgi:hypothetical protein